MVSVTTPSFTTNRPSGIALGVGVAGRTPENYSMDHSAGSYIFDPQGKLRLYVPYGRGADVFAHDIGLLLEQA